VCYGEFTLLICCVYVCVCFMFAFFSYFVMLLTILTSFTSLLPIFSALLIFTTPVVAATCAVNIVYG